MIIKLAKIINCSSEHPSYPASNLLEHPPKSSWRCAKPNELIATIIFQLAESSCITGLEIGNYRSCIVVVEASTNEEPDNWVPVVNHQFLSNDEAANNKFRDQVQLFTKRELNPEVVKIKFDRIKVSCMQSANPRELFGLEFIIFKTEVVVDLGLDVFGRFKMKEKNDDKTDEFKEKYLKLFGNKKNYKEELKEKIKESGLNNFSKKQEVVREPKKRPLLEKLEADAELKAKNQDSSSTSNSSASLYEGILNKEDTNENSAPVARTLFGDVIPSPKPKKIDADKLKINKNSNSRKRSHSPQRLPLTDTEQIKKARCSSCNSKPNELCKTCHLLPEPKLSTQPDRKKEMKITKPKKEFGKLFEDISFSLSGYVNPQRDDIRRKALKMGAKYIADPNITNNKCTHLICAFKNTPKIQQLKGHCKIVSHKFIEDCFDKKKRIPWRRYALDSKEQSKPESEEEIEGSTSPIRTPSIYDQETDDSDTNY